MDRPALSRFEKTPGLTCLPEVDRLRIAFGGLPQGVEQVGRAFAKFAPKLVVGDPRPDLALVGDVLDTEPGLVGFRRDPSPSPVDVPHLLAADERGFEPFAAEAIDAPARPATLFDAGHGIVDRTFRGHDRVGIHGAVLLSAADELAGEHEDRLGGEVPGDEDGNRATALLLDHETIRHLRQEADPRKRESLGCGIDPCTGSNTVLRRKDGSQGLSRCSSGSSSS